MLKGYLIKPQGYLLDFEKTKWWNEKCYKVNNLFADELKG